MDDWTKQRTNDQTNEWMLKWFGFGNDINDSYNNNNGHSILPNVHKFTYRFGEL